MEHTLYRFNDRWIIVEGNERYKRIYAHGTTAMHVDLNEDGMVQELPDTAHFFEHQPDHLECGTTNDLDYIYRKAIGQPVSVHDFVKSGRLILHPDRMPDYDGAHYMLRVIQHAVQHRCYENLMEALARLCCRDDQVVHLTQDSPVGSFFFRVITPDEAKGAIDDYRSSGVFTLPVRSFYHGGLIGHRKYKGGEPTEQMEWSVHT